ncbi:MAG: M23 family metallopeptidase [Cytophagales bacterium]|nr:M23 family metallopeptidase [Cytophagales bacterium]
MARIKYYYNTQTCKYERIKVSKWNILRDLLGLFAISLIIAILIFLSYSTYFDSPKARELKIENEKLKYSYSLIQKEIENTKQSLAYLQERDDHIYRTILGTEPISPAVRRAGTGGVDRYKNLVDKEKLIVDTFKKVDQLKNQLYIQTKSHDEILKLAKNRAKFLACLPAIQPISKDGLKRLTDGFGMRIHPICKIPKMHYGLDFAAPRGTPVYATGDGVVKLVKTNMGGHGNQVEINHGYGYTTKYAHLASFSVKVGQKVKRGQCIGYVGNTGVSTGPHLHYEVIKNNKRVDPLNYFIAGDLTAEDYAKMQALASRVNR